ncbi:hypothetical protein [Nocardia sp. NPDC057227]|uniref:hypothetical protein n=1 Tax=Nocardia sp. NPDC057227 TaxID=3346056 RepID=UPI0036432EEE
MAALAGTGAHRSATAEALEVAIRASWVLVLCTELYRNPFLFPTSPLAELLRGGRFTAEHLLELASADAIDQLHAMHVLATAEFVELLAAPATMEQGPVFTASTLCAADADLIVDGTLIEVKTRLGAANVRTGQHLDSQSTSDIHQMLGYTLFDTHDTYRIRALALYSARYGRLHRWPMAELLAALAGGPVDLGAERARVWELLSQGDNPHAPRKTTGSTLVRAEA